MPRALTLVALAFFSIAAWAQSSARVGDVDRVVVFGDVHGAYGALVELLETTGLIDEDSSWIGGDTHLVSLGDLLDRGPDSRAAMDLLMRLEDEAAAAGGGVHVVLGNHELMNLTGDLRYVSAAEYAAFAADETPEMRATALESMMTPEADPTAVQAEFDRKYPAGYFAHRRAFAADGVYGEWLRSLPAIVVVNDSAFVHGGLPALVAESSLDAVNTNLATGISRLLDLRAELARAAVLHPFDMQNDIARAGQMQNAERVAGTELAGLIEEFLALSNDGVIGLDGPMWYRGSMYCKPILEESVLDAALASLGVARVVVGHTPTENRRVHARYGGRLIALDTGMLKSYYNGRPAALIIDGAKTEIQYLDPVERQPFDPDVTLDAYGLTPDALRRLLTGGEVSVAEPGTVGAWQVTVAAGETTARALFYPLEDGGDMELAAAALDDLLAMDLVPPTVARGVDGVDGALQLVHPDAITEAARLERGLGIGGWCPLQPQLGLMYSFDALLFNRGRSADNIVFNNDFSDLTVTGHGTAFGSERDLYPGLDPMTLEMPAELVERLRDLDEAQAESALGAWLDRRQLRGLLARRDRLIEGRE